MTQRLIIAVLSVGSCGLLLASCITTYGTLAEDLDSKEPYRLRCSGETSQCAEAVVRVLEDGNFAVKNENEDSRTIRASKTLPTDERVFLGGVAAQKTDAQVPVREGTLVLTLARTDTNTTIEMQGLLTLAPSEREDNASGPPDTTRAFRGHPMMIRYGLSLHETDLISLVEPSSGRLRSEQLQNR